MPFESPYQAMVENELLFQQQPWTHRVPYQAAHALRPVAHALTGLGLGGGLGHVLGYPRLGAALGLAAGTAYGTVAPQPSPSQDWAFHNPEKVHVMKARAMYEMGDPLSDPKLAALATYGLVEKTAEPMALSRYLGSGAFHGGIRGAVPGAVAGYLLADDDHKLRGTLLGAGAGAGLGAGLGAGHGYYIHSSGAPYREVKVNGNFDHLMVRRPGRFTDEVFALASGGSKVYPHLKPEHLEASDFARDVVRHSVGLPPR